MFLQEIGLEESGVSRLIKSAYKLLNLQTFLTAGSDECRAWTFHKAGSSSMRRCYPYGLRKRIYPCRGDQVRGLYRLWLRAAVKEAGKMSVEGKEYVVQDGDIMHFRFNV